MYLILIKIIIIIIIEHLEDVLSEETGVDSSKSGLVPWGSGFLMVSTRVD